MDEEPLNVDIQEEIEQSPIHNFDVPDHASDTFLYRDNHFEEEKKNSPEDDVEWIDELPNDDLYTTEQQDEDYELNRWACWYGDVEDLDDHAFTNDHIWDVKIPYHEFELTDDEFFWRYENENEDYDDDKKYKMKIEYYRRKDRHWCLLCNYNLDTDSVSSHPGFEQIKELVRYGIQNRTLNILCRHIQDCYNRFLRFRLPTPIDRPPFYWAHRTIRKHLTEHDISVVMDVELTYKQFSEIGQSIHSTMYQRNRKTKQKRVDLKSVSAFMKVKKCQQDMYRFKETLKNRKRKR